MKSPNIIKSLAAVFAISSALPASAAILLVSESFDGNSADNLNGTSAGTFSSAIGDAGGSSTWGANTAFTADGGVTLYRGSAHLNLGSYINDAKGQQNGIFVLQATVALPNQDGDQPDEHIQYHNDHFQRPDADSDPRAIRRAARWTRLPHAPPPPPLIHHRLRLRNPSFTSKPRPVIPDLVRFF